MATITNKSVTTRTFNSKDFNGNPTQIDVAPGQSVEADVADPHNPVYRGWQDAGDMDFGGALTSTN